MAKRTIAGSRTLITGASSGIGRAIALALGRQGADVVATARSAERLASLQDAFRMLPGRCEVVAGDVTCEQARRAALDRAATALGGLDILINNAGIGALGPFETATPERLRQIMGVNFFAAAEMIRLALPTLKHGRRPIIVNVSSILGRRGIPHSSEYCASKFALEGFSQSLRAELHRHGIDVLVVAPGTTQTEFFEHNLEITHRPPWLDKRGVPVEKVAQETVEAIASGRREVIPSFKGRMLCWLQRFAPGVADRAMRRYG